MNWEETILDGLGKFAHAVWDALKAIGFGGGFYLLKYIHHWPAPPTTSRWYAAGVDAVWDMVGSKRMGERRDPDGNIVVLPPVPAPRPPERDDPVRQAADLIAKQEAATFTVDKVIRP